MTHSFSLFYMYNWFQFITAIIHHIYECKLQCILIMTTYMAIAFSGIGCIYTYIAISYVHGAIFRSPCYYLLLPLSPLFTYLAPSSCDRNCPPPSQVACKLTPFAPPFTQLSLPF